MDSTTQTLIVSLAGLATTTLAAGLGLYFTARGRSAPLRQHLYEQQLRLAVRIIRIIGKIRTFAPMVMQDDDPFYDQALDDLRVKVRQLSEAADSAAAILPTELYVEVQQLTRIVVDFLGLVEARKDRSTFPDQLAGRAAKTALLARTFLGVDELSTESARLFTARKELARVADLKPDTIASSARHALPKPLNGREHG